MFVFQAMNAECTNEIAIIIFIFFELLNGLEMII